MGRGKSKLSGRDNTESAPQKEHLWTCVRACKPHPRQEGVKSSLMLGQPHPTAPVRYVILRGGALKRKMPSSENAVLGVTVLDWTQSHPFGVRQSVIWLEEAELQDRGDHQQQA